MNRVALLNELASRIALISRPHPVRVGIDGVDGAGKTTLADELVQPVERLGRSVIRASIDGFHNPRSVRYQRGRNSPEGYFRDSFNHEALASLLLTPLGPGGSLKYRRAAFNYRSDEALDAPIETADSRAILIFDGVFLHRPELLPYWNFTIWLDASFEVTVPRTALRGGGSSDVEAEQNRRYVLGQMLYIEECSPNSRASLVIDNNDFGAPRIFGV